MDAADLLDSLEKWFQSKPMVIIDFGKDLEEQIRRSKNGFKKFTIASPHDSCKHLKPPTLCLTDFSSLMGSSDEELVEDEYHFDDDLSAFGTGWHIGLLSSKAAVTTFDSRLSFIHWQPLHLDSTSLRTLLEEVNKTRIRNQLRDKLTKSGVFETLGPKEAVSLLEQLMRNRQRMATIEFFAARIRNLRKRKQQEWTQTDAVRLAVAAFGLSKSDLAESVTLTRNSDSTLSEANPEARVLEDNVISADATSVAGFSLIERHLTGHAVFRNGNEQLDVYTANKGPLEKMLGVDLIYINGRLGNCVMLQYKMLEREKIPHTGQGANKEFRWVYRPDKQLFSEVKRMRIPKLEAENQDYRMNSNPFLFKFVRRLGNGKNHHSFVLSLAHFKKLLKSEGMKGPQGGLILDYDSLGGCYLRESNLIGLIQSGYLGTYRAVTDNLKVIIEQVSRGKKGLVLAWQRRMAEENGEDDLIEEKDEGEDDFFG